MQTLNKKVLFLLVMTVGLKITLIANSHLPYQIAKNPFHINKSQQIDFLEQLRVGIGTGIAFYVGDQRSFTDYTIKYGDFTEFRSSYVAEVFWQLDNRFEFGLRFIDGKSEVLKSKNTLGVQNKFNDLQLNAQYSFNNNIGLNKKRFTINGQLGLGMIRFQSRFIGIDTRTKRQNFIYSTVGYGNQYVGIATRNIPEKQNVFIGNIGLNFGVRLMPYVAIYWQNSLNLAPTYYLSGNLFKTSWLPPDGYFYTGLMVSVNFGKPNFASVNKYSKKYKCPRF